MSAQQDRLRRVFANIVDRGPIDHVKTNLIARQLGFRPHQVKTALADLVRLGLADTTRDRFTVTLHEFDDLKAAFSAFDLALSNPTPAQEGTPMAKTTAAKTTTTKAASPPVKCGCGCKQNTASGKSAFLPGHDARWVSNLVKATLQATANDNLTQTRARIASVKRDIKDKGFDALAGKFEKNATNAANKRAAKDSAAKARSASKPKDKARAKVNTTAKVDKAAKAEAEPQQTSAAPEISPAQALGYEEGTVRSGRWAYPARKFGPDSAARNTKRDGSGEWVAVDVADFVAA